MSNHSDKVVLITGGTGGIGLEISMGLAKLGGTIVVVGRHSARGREAVAAIQAKSGNSSVGLMLADLSSQGDIRQLAREFRARYTRLDVLVNNAGGLFGKRWETVDGIEGTFALNHLCPFLLTHLLLPVLHAGAPSRIVNVNSEGHRAARTVDFDSLTPARWRRGFLIYSQSKLANLLFTYELAKRLSPTQITVNALHPGIVDTQLFRRFISERFSVAGDLFSKVTSLIARKVAYRLTKFDTVEAAAQCPIYLASSSDVADTTGTYFDSGNKIIASSDASHDAALSRQVWNISARLVGLTEGMDEAIYSGAGLRTGCTS